MQSSTLQAFFLPYHNLNFKMCCFESLFCWNWGFLKLAETLSIKKASNRSWPVLEMQELKNHTLKRVLCCSLASRAPESVPRGAVVNVPQVSGTGAVVTFQWHPGGTGGRAGIGDVWASRGEMEKRNSSRWRGWLLVSSGKCHHPWQGLTSPEVSWESPGCHWREGQG